MLLLATQAEPQMAEHRHPNLGRLLQPRHYPRARATAVSGVPWAADNDAFNGWDADSERRFLRMVDTLSGLPGCLFVVCPDVVGEAGLTSLLFEEYAPVFWRHDLPPAYVLPEPGVEYERSWIPWGSIGALFIGCASNQFKLGPEVEAIVAEASQRKIWTHMGRVNSLRRLAYAASIGCDSIDGTTWVRYRGTYLAARHRYGRVGRIARRPALVLGNVSRAPTRSAASDQERKRSGLSARRTAARIRPAALHRKPLACPSTRRSGVTSSGVKCPLRFRSCWPRIWVCESVSARGRGLPGGNEGLHLGGLAGAARCWHDPPCRHHETQESARTDELDHRLTYRA